MRQFISRTSDSIRFRHKNAILSLTAVAVAGAIASSCCDDFTFPVPDTGNGQTLCFSVSEDNQWKSLSEGSSTTRSDTLWRNDRVFTFNGPAGNDSVFAHTRCSYNQNHVFGYKEDNAEPASRAEKRNLSEYGSIGVFASIYEGNWDESALYYLRNERCDQSGGDGSLAYKPLNELFWPGEDYNTRIFAYAPYDAEGISFPDNSSTGSLSITYKPSTNFGEQVDLMVAMSDRSANAAGTQPLTFKHALAALKFNFASTIKGKVESLRLEGIYGEATINMSSFEWSGFGEASTIYEATATNPEGDTPLDDAVFLIIPQSFPEGSKIIVNFIDELTGGTWNISADLNGYKVNAGTETVFNITSSNILVTPKIVATEGEEIRFELQETNMRSLGFEAYYEVSYADQESRLVEAPVESIQFSFVEEDSEGTYTEITQPDWIANVTKSEDAAYSKKLGISLNEQYIKKNVHTEELRSRPSVADYDLSTLGGESKMTTSNCYVVNQPGTYKLPLVYGCAIQANNLYINSKDIEINISHYAYHQHSEKVYTFLDPFVNHLDNGVDNPYIYENKGCTPSDAKIVWQDVEGLVSDVSLCDINDNNVYTYISFKVDSNTIEQGNAVIAVTDKDDIIMWSWHIWVTDFDIYDHKNIRKRKNITSYNTNLDVYISTVDIGWCDPYPEEYEEQKATLKVTLNPLDGSEPTSKMFTVVREGAITGNDVGRQTFYQWGRKDPMPPLVIKSDYFSFPNSFYDGEGCGFEDATLYNGKFKKVKGPTDIATMIKNPDTFYYNDEVEPYSSATSTNSDTYDNNSLYDGICYPNLWDTGYYGGYFVSLNTHEFGNYKTIYDPSPRGFRLSQINHIKEDGNYNTSGTYYTTSSNYYDYDGNDNASINFPMGPERCCKSGEAYFNEYISSPNEMRFYHTITTDVYRSKKVDYIIPSYGYGFGLNNTFTVKSASGYPVRPIVDIQY